MATYKQDGSKVKNPVFPYSLRFEPYDVLRKNYDNSTDVFEQIADVEEISLLYNVYAMDKPEAQGGKEQLIARIVNTTKFTTSKWGDKHMYFRHSRHDDDFRYKKEWKDDTPVFLFDNEENDLRAYQVQKPSNCPLAWIFQ